MTPTPTLITAIEVNVWFTGSDMEEIHDNMMCVRNAAGRTENSTGLTHGPPITMDMQFRCGSDIEAQALLDRILLSCSWVKGEVRW